MKYFVIQYKHKDYSTIRDGWWHGYAESADAAKAALLADPLSPKIEGIVDITEHGFEIGDLVKVSEDYTPRELWHDDPGEVVRYEFDGYIVVKWDWLEEGWIEEEFHWTELKKENKVSNQLNHFKVFYTNGQYYFTQANGTAAEFEAYLKQDGGRVTFEDSNGKETHLWIDRVEDVLAHLVDEKDKAFKAYEKSPSNETWETYLEAAKAVEAITG